MIDALVDLEGDGEVDRVAPALDQAQRTRSRLDRAVAAAAVFVPDVPVHEEALLLHRDLLGVLGMLAHLLEHAFASRTLSLVVGEPSRVGSFTCDLRRVRDCAIFFPRWQATASGDR